MGAHERADAEALAELLREDARLTMPPIPTWYDGREAIMTAQRQGWDPEFGQLRGLVTAANTQPAAAHYLRRPGETEYRPLALDVLRLEAGGWRRSPRSSLRSCFRRSAFRRRSDRPVFRGSAFYV